MGISVANILLQVTGESDDAQRELEAVARRLALFGRETAEAEADLDTTPANEALDELKVRLAEFSADDHSAEVRTSSLPKRRRISPSCKPSSTASTGRT